MLAIEMALDAGLMIMRNGGSTLAAERCVKDVLAGFGERGVATVWRLDAVTAVGTVDGRSATVVRPVGPIGGNLVRASAATVLGERVASGQISPHAVPAELAHIATLGPPRNRWLIVLVAAGAAACYSQIAGGDWGSLAVAFVAAAMGQTLRAQLQAHKVGVAAVTLAAGVLSALVASLGLRLGLTTVAPATLVGAVIYMVPGMPLINGFFDVVSYRHLLVGIERIVTALTIFLILAIAIVFAHTFVQQ